MTIKGFKIWYTDGSVIKSEDWRSLPSTGIQSIVTYMQEEFQPGRVYREIAEGADWYWFDGEHVRTVPSGEDGWQPKPINVADEDIKQGEYAATFEDYDNISNIAYNEYNY
jgi:hypothetical protein